MGIVSQKQRSGEPLTKLQRKVLALACAPAGEAMAGKYMRSARLLARRGYVTIQERVIATELGRAARAVDVERRIACAE